MKINRKHDVGVVLLMAVLLWSCRETSTGFHPSIGPIVESVYASATVQPDSLYEVYSPRQGIIDDILVEEGQRVETGQLLAVLVNEVPALNSQRTSYNLQLAEEQYRGRSALLYNYAAEIRSNERQVARDSIQYFRQKRLWSKGIGAKMEVEDRQLKYEQTLDRLYNSRKKYEQAQLELENAYRNAQNANRSAQTERQEYFLRSRMEGKVFAIHKELGELITLPEAFASIGSAESYLIDMSVDEVDITRIHPGQQVLIRLDAYNDTVFEAEVDRIYPQKDSRTQSFRVEGFFTAPPHRLYPGLLGEANIIIREKSRAISIPLEYLTADNRVKTEQGEVDVQTGLRNMEEVEILAGIDSTTVLLKP